MRVYRKKLNSNGQQFHQYQQNEQSPFSINQIRTSENCRLIASFTLVPNIADLHHKRKLSIVKLKIKKKKILS